MKAKETTEKARKLPTAMQWLVTAALIGALCAGFVTLAGEPVEMMSLGWFMLLKVAAIVAMAAAITALHRLDRANMIDDVNAALGRLFGEEGGTE